MGMACCFCEADDSQIDELLSRPGSIHGFLDQAAEQGDLDKAWHGLHFLLTGSAEGGPEPWGYLLEGGESIGAVDVGYGPARALRPAQVASFAAALSAVSPDELRKRFDPTAMRRAGIYPDIWRPEDPEPLEYVLYYYGALRAFVERASSRHKGIIIYYT